MHIQGLRVYILVMRSGTLSRAAKDMNLSMSSASRHLSILEHELGVVLFERQKRQLTPTPEGKAFLQEAQRIIRIIDDAPQVFRSIRSGISRSIRIVAMPRLSICIASPATIRFIKEFPDVKVTLDELPIRLFETWMASLHFDLGLGSLPTVHDAIKSETLHIFKGVAVFPSGHPLTKKTCVTHKDLASLPLVAPARGTRIRYQIDSFLAATDLPPKLRVETATSGLSCGIVADGYGFTISDPMVPMAVGRGRLATVPLKPDLDMTFGFMYPRSLKLTPLMRRYMEIVRQVTDEFVCEHIKV